nr:NADH dehydrogenase subunit 2 [Tropiduchidae sp. 2 WQW-2023a]
MKLNLTNMMMMLMITLTTLSILASNSILSSWMMMEINLISFMPMMTKSKNMKDQTMKYFIIQNVSSSIMILSIMFNSTMNTPINTSIMLMTSMMMKMGMVPFHLWMPMIMQSMTWKTCMMFTTWQKLAPTMLTSQILSMKTIMIPMCLSMLIPPISAMNQSSTKKILAYSSISNSPWMVSAALMSKKEFLLFFSSYSILNILTMKILMNNNLMFLNQIKTNDKKTKTEILINFISMSGIPPFTGFLPKWLIMNFFIEKSMIILPTCMILSSIVSSFVYLNMISPIMLSSSKMKKSQKKKNFMNLSTIFNLWGIPTMIFMI